VEPGKLKERERERERKRTGWSSVAEYLPSIHEAHPALEKNRERRGEGRSWEEEEKEQGERRGRRVVATYQRRSAEIKQDTHEEVSDPL
jgi:hypothetical protein